MKIGGCVACWVGGLIGAKVEKITGFWPVLGFGVTVFGAVPIGLNVGWPPVKIVEGVCGGFGPKDEKTNWNCVVEVGDSFVIFVEVETPEVKTKVAQQTFTSAPS